jgi:hypothetical protein
MHHIEGMFSATKAYERAGEKCPNGYDILSNRQQGLFTILEVECR